MSKQDHYRKTLQLPQTDFPMKACLPEREPEIIRAWNTNQIYKKILEKRKNSKTFFLQDGPPYSNGSIHIGHVLNKILKDIVIKYKNMSGFKASFLPTWDCHGLPIELKALEGISSEEKLDSVSVRKACRKEALFWMEKQRASFQRLGILADWENPVLTMDPDYEAEEIRFLAQLIKKGLIYRGKKPVFWCFKLQTALAFSEAEYREHKSSSIYVKFYLDAKSKKKLSSKKPIAVVIWTTTAWTLPANSGICLHPDFEYNLYEGEKESYLVAQALSESFFKEINRTPLKSIKSFKGSELEGLVTRHPFLDRDSPLVLGDHVSLEAGTGCVHTAPGHGLEDHIVGKKYNLPAYCPVDSKGHFTQELPDNLKGLFIFKGGKVIIELLEKSDQLLAEKQITHSYPYNPRSNSPLIYRLTPQWFLSLDEKKEGSSVRLQALKSCEEKIRFIPDWGKSRLNSMITTSPDWCLSRQRTWGVPFVVFYCKNCDLELVDPKIMEEIADEMEKTKQGIEYYFLTKESQLLPKNIKCQNCSGQEFTKGKDILDVWFDSGIQHSIFKKHTERGAKFPADLFLEGSDQHRGWFQTSLISSLALYNEVPFKTLLTHGFVNDNKGHKMSKSKGNVLDPASIIEKSGAEILRLWVASENYSFDIGSGEENFQRVTESYRRFRNTFRFLLGNLKDFDPLTESVDFKDLNCVDKWLLIEFNAFIETITQSFENFAFHRAYQQFNHFFTVHLSAFYLDIIKDRLYTFSKQSSHRKKAQTVLYQLMDKLLPLMAPFTSFLAEEVYSYMPNKKKESVFLEDFPVMLNEWEDEETKKIFLKLFPLREKINKQLEALRKQGQIGSNLQACVILILKEDFISPMMEAQEILEFFGISKIVIKEGNEQIQVHPAQGEKCLRCWFVSEDLNSDSICSKCVEQLKDV